MGTADRTFLCIVLVACVAALGWQGIKLFPFPTAIVPDPEPGPDTAQVTTSPGSVVNMVTAKAAPLRLVYGPYMMMPPVVPYASQRAEPINS